MQVLQRALPLENYRLLPRERIVAAALGLTRSEAHRAFVRARLAFEREEHSKQDFDWESVVLAEKRRAISSSDVVEFVETEEHLGTVGGLDELKDWLETRKAAFTEEARAFGLPVPRGLLLVGVQGCGKSLLAKAIAKHWGLPLLRLDLGSIFAGKHAPDAALNRALRIAETLSPCILWTDEIEKAFGNDGSGIASRILGTMLTWLQEKNSEVFYVATANEVTEIPPELLRKGRFDELFFVDLPDREARAHIFSIHLRKRRRKPGDFDLAELSAKTEHYSGAEIEQIVIAALYEAFAEGRELHMRDLLAVIDESVPLYATREEAIKALREWASSRTRFAAKDLRLSSFFDDD
jgi:SpoVK/Ycf46/Vps4 family AAA+-type ATPase